MVESVKIEIVNLYFQIIHVMQMIPTIIVAVIMYIIVVLMKGIAIIMESVENLDVETIIVHKASHPTLKTVATFTLLVRRDIKKQTI